MKKTIFSDNFETGVLSGWTKTGTVNIWKNSPKDGSYSLQVVKTGQISRTISTTGYSNISVSFVMGADSLEKKDSVDAMWYNGASWTTLGTLSDGQETSILYPFTIDLPATADNNSNVQLLFEINGGNGDYGYFDDIVVTGIPT